MERNNGGVINLPKSQNVCRFASENLETKHYNFPAVFGGQMGATQGGFIKGSLLLEIPVIGF